MGRHRAYSHEVPLTRDFVPNAVASRPGKRPFPMWKFRQLVQARGGESSVPCSPEIHLSSFQIGWDKILRDAHVQALAVYKGDNDRFQ